MLSLFDKSVYSRIFYQGIEGNMLGSWTQKVIGFLSALAVVALLSASVAAGSCGGGGEVAKISITPTTKTFSSLNKHEPFLIKNTGTVTWDLTSLTVSSNFQRADPNACLIQTFPPGQECVVHASAVAAGKTGTLTAGTDKSVSASSTLHS
jgi:hypothetical protein